MTKSVSNQMVLIAVLSLVTLAIAPWIGKLSLPWSVLTTSVEEDTLARVFWQIRVPRTILSFVCGGLLACCGVAFQALFRNPLASPFTLGVSGGASCGVALYLLLGGGFSLLGISGVSVSAFVGALISVMIILTVASLLKSAGSFVILLCGVALSFFFSSGTMLFQAMADIGDTFRLMHWMMGDFSSSSPEALLRLAPFAIAGLLVLFFYRDELNLISLGDELAASKGLEVNLVRNFLLLAVSVIMAGVISVAGPIGFVGIIVPHIARLFTGANHRHLLLSSFLLGGMFLTISDTIARSLLSQGELPVGVITALCGGPFFIWVLVKKRKSFGAGQ